MKSFLLLSLFHKFSPVHERKDDDKVMFQCSVLAYERCQHTVQWLYKGNKEDITDLKASQSTCSGSVIFTTSHLNKSKYNESFSCRVTDCNSGNLLLCDLTPVSSCKKIGRFVHSVDLKF